MLLFFTCKNWMSYREEMQFSMYATGGKKFASRLAKLKYGRKVLPCAMIFGGNSSGKSNFLDAIAFVKNFVLREADCSMIKPFVLEKNTANDPSEFMLDIYSRGSYYRYFLTCRRDIVLAEELFLLEGRNGNPRKLFERNTTKLLVFDANGHVRKKSLYAGRRRYTVLDCVDGKIFADFMYWFKVTLNVQGSRFENPQAFDVVKKLRENKLLLGLVNELLPLLDNGISRICIDDNDNAKLRAVHINRYGEEIVMNFSEESRGMRRLLRILPALSLAIGDNGSPAVLVIDEWDQSFHTLLAHELMSFYLSRCNSQSRSQCIFSTHDLNLLSGELFRPDELWIAERKRDGSSHLTPLSDFSYMRGRKTNYRELYLGGRLGGLPDLNRFLLLEKLKSTEASQDKDSKAQAEDSTK